MSAESYGGSAPSPTDEFPSADPMSREEIENSVLDAIRPLLRPRGKKTEEAGEASKAGQASKSGEISKPGESSKSSETSKSAHEAEAASADEPPPATRTGAHVPADAGLPASVDEDVAPSASPSDLTDQTEDRTTEMNEHVTAEDKTLDTFVAARDFHDEDTFETFMEIGEDLERRSRRSATMARLLEQHRHQLQTAEKERDEAYEKLSRVYPVVQETTRALKEAMDARKVDEDSSRMQRLFQLNGRALDELEKVSVTLFADFLWCKTAWEQYAKTVEDARQLRSNAET